MKELICVLGFVLAALFLNSCSMKECKCIDSNLSFQNGNLLEEYSGIDTVYNNTRSDCEQFNQDEWIEFDSIRKIHHTIICEEN